MSTSPVTVFAPAPFAAATSTVSGRMSTRTRAPRSLPRAASTVSVTPPVSTAPVEGSTTVASSRFIVPMNSATNGVAGAVYISAGAPICSMRPRYMTAT